MKHRLMSAIKSKFSIVVASGLLAVILLSGLPYAITHSTFFSPSKAHAAGTNPVATENQLPGTPGWNDFSADLAPDTLSGFGSKISVNHGDSIDFYVTTTAPSFKIDIFRTGYYNQVGARLITSLGSFPGLHQAIPAPDAVTGMISCTNWTRTTSLTIPSNWVSGVYLAKLTSSTNKSSFIFFVVRNDGGNEDILFQTSVTTYQAYNLWGGTSLYGKDSSVKSYSGAHATKVSFDRPFNPGDSNGAGHYFFFEYSFVYWMESQGYNVAYTTNVDTDARPAEIQKHKAFLSVGHDEYWSMGMRNAVQSAINAGVNVAFFSANTMYWQIRFEPNTAGVADRVEVGYKDFATSTSPPGPDPMWNVNNSLVTTLWRDPVVNMPENGMLGVMFEQQNVDSAYVVENASNWIYAGTGFVDGTSIPGIVGYEYDKVWNNGFTPPNVTVLSNSPVTGTGGGFSSFSNSTLYTAPGGARVFAAGTIEWSLGLSNVLGNTYQNAGIQKTTMNILNNFIGSSSAPTSGVSMSSDSVAFGNQGVHTTSAAQTVKITNSGTAALTISGIAVTGTNASDFAQTNTCSGSLAVNASCTVSVTFTPTASGTRSANITLTDSSAQSPQVVVLGGTGIASGSAVSLSASNLNFGNQTVGTTSPTQTVTVTNSGVAPLTFSYIQLQGLNTNDFGLTHNCPTSLAVGASCKLNVTFNPTASSTRSAYVTLIDNASDSAQNVVLSGTGVAANAGVKLSPSNLSFGNQNIGTTSSAQTVTLTNTSTTALTISSIALTGTNANAFAQTNTCPLSPNTLAVNANCTISVTFTPQDTSTEGTLTANVTITDNGNGSPQTVTLSGTATEPTSGVNLNPNLLNFGNQNNGTTSNAQTVTLTNNGTAALAISSIVLAGTNASDFAQTNTCPVSPNTLAVNANCTISVTFKPTASGSRSASVTITDNTDGEGEAVQNIPLNGTGVSTTTSVYFSDGFESADLSQWTNGASGTGTATVQSSLVNSGKDALQLTNATTQSVQVSTTLNGTPALTYTKFAFRFSSLSGTTLIALGQDSSGHNQWIMYYDSGRQGLDTYFWNGAGARYDVYSNANLISPNTWYTIEVETNQATSGHGEVWLNGTSVGSFDGDLTQTASYGKLVLDNEVTGTAYFDDVAVANTFTIPAGSSSVKLAPKTLSFGNQTLNTASGAQTVTMTNTGTAALTISSIAVAGTNASDFAQTNTCTSSLAVNASCTISVTFTPGASGARSGSITLTDSSVDSPQTIALSGTGVATAAGVSLNPSSLSFGNQNTGTASNAQTVTVTNSGTAALTISGITVTGTNASDFAQTNTCSGSLTVSASCIISVTFTPGVSGARSGSVTIADNATGSPQSIALSGTGVGTSSTPTASFSDGFESADLSQWTNGASGTGTATVQTSLVNSGKDALQLTNAANQSVQVSTAFKGAPALTYTRFYFRNASLSGTTLIALGQDGSGHNQWIMYYDSGRQGLDTYFWNEAGTRYDVYSNANLLSSNTWYSIEVEMNQATSGHGEVWLNGTSVGSFDGDLSQTASYGKLAVNNEATGTAYFDDVVVSNGYNGLVSQTPGSPTPTTVASQGAGTNNGTLAFSINSFALPEQRRQLQRL